MSFTRRQTTRTDAAQPDIVSALRKAGCVVEIIGRPVDLLVWHPRFGPGQFKAIECKSPDSTGKRRARRDQEAQEAFCRETGTPVALTPQQALEALGLWPDGYTVGHL